MSDAPSLIASISIFWMNLTTGASSTSPELSSSGFPRHPGRAGPCRSLRRWSRSASEVDSASVCRSWASLDCSTTTGSTDMPVWKRISSSARRLVGSAIATARRLPRLPRATTSCFIAQLRVDGILGKVCRVDRRQVEQRISEGQRAKACQVTAIDELALDQLADECTMSALGGGRAFECILLGDTALLDQRPGKTAHCDLRISCHFSLF